MRAVLNAVMQRRAEQLADLLIAHLPAHGPILDIGAGTGHNAVALQRRRSGTVVGLDVADLHVVGAPPARFDGRRMPFTGDRFAAGLLLYVLHYCPDPVALLREARRVCNGPLLVLQSTSEGRIAETLLRLYDLAWGPLALRIARIAGFVAPGPAPLYARVLATRPALLRTFAQAGLRPALVHSAAWTPAAIRRDLYVLERLPGWRHAP